MLKKLPTTILLLFIAAGSCFASNAVKSNNKKSLEHAPKNIIIMIADGCGYNHIDLVSLYQYGKTGQQVYEGFPVKLGMSTFPSGGGYDIEKASHNFNYFDKKSTDSAAAATAMSCGLKTNNKSIGVDVNDRPVKNLIERCEELGKSTGVVTSVYFSDATPAGFVAHNTSRKNYSQIANEMIYKSSCEVIMGCGAPDFGNNGKTGVFNNKKYIGGSKAWSDIVDDGKVLGSDCDGDNLKDFWTIVRSRKDFKSLAKGQPPKRVLGIPMVHKTLQQTRSGNAKAKAFKVPFVNNVPSLTEMSLAALNVLDADEDGFFLMIEGGAIDWASHKNQSGRVIEEMIDFNKAVNSVVEWVEINSDWNETIVIVTSDHETGHMAGPKGNRIVNNCIGGVFPDIRWNSSSHTNQLVPFFAKGRGCQRFKDVVVDIDPVRGAYIDNTSVANVIFSILD